LPWKERKALDEKQSFIAEWERQTYTAGSTVLIVSPANARKEISTFITQARKQLLIYDTKIADKQMMKLLEAHAKAGLDIKIIGSVAAHGSKLDVRPLTRMRLHTRSIVRDGTQAFIGSQSLRQPELDLRREIGIIVKDSSVVKSLTSTFQEDWLASDFGQVRDMAKINGATVLKMRRRPSGHLLRRCPP
jgi:phosphatidylserine/phosphatidylglycerophosphate/cardiolipin synthase-like enzyme